jgi:hypothetical protein
MISDQIELSDTTIKLMLNVWMSDVRAHTFDMDILEYYNWLKWDISINYKGTAHKTMEPFRDTNQVFIGSEHTITIPAHQLSFFLLSL